MTSELIKNQAKLSEAAFERIGSHITKTPVLLSSVPTSDATQVYLKLESFQKTGSFKFRGAMSKLTSLSVDKPVITASSGNHGIACAQAAQITGHQLTVVLPENVAKAKLAKIQAFGVKTLLHPGDSGLAEQHARTLASEGGYEYVSPYNDPQIMAGQGTVGLELLEQLPNIDNVFISMGGGGLISGVGSVIKSVSLNTKIIGVSAINSAAFDASLKAKRIVETEHLDTLADGCAGGVDDDAVTLPIASEVVDHTVCCSEQQIASALRDIAWHDKQLVEGAAALALAGYQAEQDRYKGQTNVIVICGANFDKQRIQSVLAEDPSE